MSQKRRSRSEKAFYILSLLIVISMVVGLIAVAITPTGIGF
jgi:type II secretory pathway pseudopilin PulG